ncbi:hypothetical protein [Jonquetella anthropi]|uniref:hypothetical protein n=1 Tax=Jonquetella anthropi TaxID=428712 RepID=UPI0023F3E297|nr:hypothetical protein [Jonquetella anthropi]
MSDEMKKTEVDSASLASSIPSAEEYKKTVEQLSSLGDRLFACCAELGETLTSERARAASAEKSFRDDIKQRDDAIDQLQKQLIENRSALDEAQRNINSMSIQTQQLSEALRNYRHDVTLSEQLSSDLRSARSESALLKATIEEMKAEMARAERLHKDAAECLKLKHSQEQLVAGESVRAAEDRATQLQAALARSEEQLRQSEEMNKLLADEAERAKREDRDRFDKVRGELLHVQSQLADQERAFQDLQKDVDRRIRAGVRKVEIKAHSVEEDLRQKLDEKERQLRMADFRLTQAAEDHQRALLAARADFETKLNMKTEEVRRQLYAKAKSPKNDG